MTTTQFAMLVFELQIAAFVTQQFVQVFIDDPVTRHIRRKMKARLGATGIIETKLYAKTLLEPEIKKYWLGRISTVVGCLISWLVPIRILQSTAIITAANSQASIGFGLQFVDVVITGLVIGSGTEGVNSVLKYFQYLKDTKGSVVPAIAGHASLQLEGASDQSNTPHALLADVQVANPNNGPVLSPAFIRIVFWGSRWTAAGHLQPDDTYKAIRTLFGSSYTSGLGEYGVTPPKLISGWWSVDDPASDPPNLFGLNDTNALVEKMISTQGFLPVVQGLYGIVILLPSDVSFEETTTLGEHTYYPPQGSLDGSVYPYAWVTHSSGETMEDTLASLTRTLSHELVEMCTNPLLNAWADVNNSCGNPCEIVDICQSSGQPGGTINNVAVEAYWSESNKRCVIPGAAPPA